MVPRPEPRDARCAGDPPPSTTPPVAAAVPHPATVALDVELTATVDHAALLRRRFRAWLAPLTIDLDVLEDLVLAVYEALSNAVDHAYRDAVSPGLVMLRAELATAGPDGSHQHGQLHIRVADHGTWHTPPGDPGWRGRGFELMRGLTDTTRVEQAPDGTTVHLHRHLRTA